MTSIVLLLLLLLFTELVCLTTAFEGSEQSFVCMMFLVYLVALLVSREQLFQPS